MEDREIIELYWRRSERAIACSEEKYGAYCRAVARQILRSLEDTEECVSDTWLAAWNAMPPHRPAVLRTFLGRLTRNLAVNRLLGWRRGPEFAHAQELLNAYSEGGLLAVSALRDSDNPS